MKRWSLSLFLLAVACTTPAEESEPEQNVKPAEAEPRPPGIAGTLTFSWDGQEKTLPIEALLQKQQPSEIEVDDPYYKKKKRYRAVALVPLLEQGFGKGREELAGAHFVLEAKDGYQTPIDGQKLLVPAVHL